MLCPLSRAQSFQLFDASGTLNAGDTIQLDISYEDYDISVPIGITNTASTNKAVNVTRYEVDVLPNTSSYFCWGSCTGVTPAGSAPVVTPSGSVNMGVGSTLSANDNGFVFHYDPNFQIGTSLFRIRFFDVANPSDSADMYISIRSMQLNALTANYLETVAYPNPVSETLFLEKEGLLFNNLGQCVQQLTIGSNDLSSLPEGCYFLKCAESLLQIIKAP
jgi:hypothetical protein